MTNVIVFVYGHTVTIDKITADYLNTKAAADRKTPAQNISEMVQERIATIL